MTKEKSIKYSLLKALVLIGVFLFLIVLGVCATPGYLFAFSLLLLVLTFGKLLDAQQTIFCKFLKYSLYVVYLIYSIYKFVPMLFEPELIITPENTTKIVMGVVAPLCLFVLIKILSNTRIRHRKVFNYHILWILYLIVALIWSYFYPKEVYLDFLIAYWILSYVIVYSYKKKKNVKGVDI